MPVKSANHLARQEVPAHGKFCRDGGQGQSKNCQNLYGGGGGMAIQSFLLKAVTSVQEWLGVAAALFLLFAAVELFTAGDNPNQRSHAWHRLLAVASGLMVIIFAKDLIGLLYSWAGAATPF
jgi:hypothetical protein